MSLLPALLSVTVSVPEPSTLALLAFGLSGVAFEARRRRKGNRRD